MNAPKVTVEVGQPVIIHSGDRYHRTRGGTVAKVARVWIEIQPDDNPHERARQKFRLDDQTDGRDIDTPTRFYTLDQWAERERQAEAVVFLREQGIDLRPGSPWRLREAELADLIRAHLEPPAPDGPLGGAIDGPSGAPTADGT